VHQQYTVFLDEVIKQSSHFATFNPTGSSTQQRGRVDSLFCDTTSQNQSCKQLWTVVKQVLLLSRGQATVEHGFLINKEMKVENMTGSTFVAKRMVYDHIHSVGGINNIDVQLLLYCANVRHSYSAYLEEQKSASSRVVAGQNRTALIDEVGKLKVKRRALSASADDFSNQAEKLQQLTFLSKANGMR